MKMVRKNKRRLQVAICLLLVPMLLTGCVKVSPMGLMMQWTVSQEPAGATYVEEPLPEPYYTEEPEVSEPYGEQEQVISTQEQTLEPQPSTPVEPVYVSDGKYAQTIMVYMVGSDLESDYGNGTLDLEEMMAANADVQHNNIVVFAGGASDWQIPGLSADKNSILKLREDGNFGMVEQLDAENMGEADTLSYFINYCFENYEAENYGLVLWDHGGGPVVGFGIDENYRDLLTMEEMQTAFEDSVGVHGEKLEWVGFDACLMNSLEVADLLAPYANYMIASQETEPGWGWNYAFLAETSNKAMTGEEVGKAVIDYYMMFGEELFDISPRFYCDLTLSCIDLQRYQEVEAALNSCFSELDEELTVETYPEMMRNRARTRAFGIFSSNFDYGMVDAVHLLNQIASESTEAANAVKSIESMVVYSKSNMRNANGISICYPYSSGNDYAQECMAIQEELGFSEEYTGFLRKFYSIKNGEQLISDWDFSRAATSVATIEAENEVNTSDISLQLTEEQQENMVYADYLILVNVKGAGLCEDSDTLQENPRLEDMYLFVHRGKDVEVDENGVLHAYYGNRALYIHDYTDNCYSPIPLILNQAEVLEEEERYTCHAVLSNWNLSEDIMDWYVEGGEMQIVVNAENPNGIIRSVIPSGDGDELNPSKQLLDLEDFGIMEIGASVNYFTRGEDGEMIDFFAWEDADWYMGISQDITHDYALEMRPLEDPENYVCLFRIKDAQGNISYSELIPLE